MANIRISNLDDLTDALNPNSFLVLEQENSSNNYISYRITLDDVLTEGFNSAFNDTTISGDFISSGTTTISNVNVPTDGITFLSAITETTDSDSVSLTVNRVGLSDASLTWDETNDEWTFGNFVVKANDFVNSAGVPYALSNVQVTTNGGLSGFGTLASDFELSLSDSIPKNINFEGVASFSGDGPDSGVVFNSDSLGVSGGAHQVSPETLRFFSATSNSSTFEFGLYGTYDSDAYTGSGFTPWLTLSESGVTVSGSTSTDSLSVSGSVSLPNNSITNNMISSLDGSKIVDNSITSAEIGPNAVGSSELANTVTLSSLFITNRLYLPDSYELSSSTFFSNEGDNGGTRIRLTVDSQPLIDFYGFENDSENQTVNVLGSTLKLENNSTLIIPIK